ncbi:ABC-2 type transport system permease protein [Enterococcus sp. PF1-24]|uniref:ABC transporter permease n=1 Tax=unclassified Enterococcus TaxID=2608891 RepID=UPI0024768809|nr:MULTISPECIES: ABC transporter permease [unclassified Enterococcus]MDH6365700.1 ABC-2 type transport system permease protein [Enterococcus sp. PFB1-1]MDH6402800.1 ABC-2 type transport system permease protein [Enterococcus sp. PF1-24]
MKQLIIFMKKEIFEAFKTKKLLIIAVSFLALGIMNPLIAKLTPEIMKSTLPKGISLEIPAPTSLDSWSQFFKNINQLGLIVLLILFCEILAREIETGSLINLLTKGLSRTVIVLCKQFFLWGVWTVALFLSFIVTYFYTKFYFPDDLSPAIFPAIFSLWLFGLLMFAVLLLGSALAKSGFQGLFLVLLFYGGGIFSTMFTKIDYYNPFALSTKNMLFLQERADLGDFLPAIALTTLLTLVILWLSIKIFSKKRL